MKLYLNLHLTKEHSSWSRVSFETLIIPHLDRNVPVYCAPQRFITSVTRDCHLPLSWANSIQSMPSHPVSLRPILIFSSYLCLGLPISLLLDVFLPKLCMHLASPPYIPHTLALSFCWYDDPDNPWVGRDSIVGIVTRYGLDGPGIESRWGRDFPHPSRLALGPTQPPRQWVPGLFPGVKRPGRGIDHPPHLVPRLKKE